mmetsp:Transcript_105193/g.280012  ORF Transcript_105193/g.280012 Transcript_105193/m.280012 type:complete len:272 (-) Transcript_105193:55-870(-)
MPAAIIAPVLERSTHGLEQHADGEDVQAISLVRWQVARTAVSRATTHGAVHCVPPASAELPLRLGAPCHVQRAVHLPRADRQVVRWRHDRVVDEHCEGLYVSDEKKRVVLNDPHLAAIAGRCRVAIEAARVHALVVLVHQRGDHDGALLHNSGGVATHPCAVVVREAWSEAAAARVARGGPAAAVPRATISQLAARSEFVLAVGLVRVAVPRGLLQRQPHGVLRRREPQVAVLGDELVDQNIEADDGQEEVVQQSEASIADLDRLGRRVRE